MKTDNIKIVGTVHTVLTREDGTVKQEDTKQNLVVTVGKTFLATAMTNLTSITFTHVGIGTSLAAPTIADTTLIGTELSRVAATVTHPTATTTQFVASYAAGIGTGTIEEAGIFSAVSAGSMFSRYLTGTYSKAATDTLTITWTISVV